MLLAEKWSHHAGERQGARPQLACEVKAAGRALTRFQYPAEAGSRVRTQEPPPAEGTRLTAAAPSALARAERGSRPPGGSCGLSG